MAKTEANLDKRLTKACKLKRIKTVLVDPIIYNGFPDRIIFNQHIKDIHYVELKNNTYYERTHNQEVWANIVESCGGSYFLLDGDKEVNDYIKKYIEGETK